MRHNELRNTDPKSNNAVRRREDMRIASHHTYRSSAICVPDSSGGGINTFYVHNSNETSFDEIRSILIDANPFRVAGGVARCSQGPLTTSLSHLLAVARMSYARSLAAGADVLELCDWPLGFVPAVLDQRMPYIVQCHGSMGQIADHDPQEGAELEEAFVQLIEPQLLRCAHRVQTLSITNKRFWEEATGRSIEVIRPAFPLPALPTETSIDSIGRVFGRLQRWKGPHILCEALNKLGRNAPQIDWHGGIKPWGSDNWPADRRLAADFPKVWGVKLNHRPAVPRHEVLALQASALFNVVPSTWDVFNFTAVESMAAARPTIVSTGAGASELIVNGENGFIFEKEDADALAAVIDRVLCMPEAKRREIGAAGRETIRVELDPARIAQQRLAAYEEAINSFYAAPPPRPHDWLLRLLTSQTSARKDFNALLSPVPLRAMPKHIGRRLLAKLRVNFSR